MKHLGITLLACLILAGSVSSKDAEEIRWTNYFGIGGGFEIENIVQDHTALHMNGAISRRMLPHFHLMLQIGFYPFSNDNILSAFGDTYFEILTVGLTGKVGTATGGHGPSFYALVSGGWTALKNINNSTYYSVGGGFETELAPRLGIFFQTQYFNVDAPDASIQFATLSAGVSFSPR